MSELIGNARASKADVHILVANVVDRLFLQGREDLVVNTQIYNQMLASAIPGWSTAESPVALVDVHGNYDCHPDSCPDGYDGLHPTAMGEYHIAQAFASVLKATFNFQGFDFVIPAKAEPRIVNGMTDWWSDARVYPFTTASITTWIENGQTWEFQVRTVGDGTDTSDWTASTFATAELQTALGPSGIVSNPVGSDCIAISWAPVAEYDVNRYGVIAWDEDDPNAYISIQAASGTSFTCTGLASGHRYGTWVVAYVNLEGSLTGKPMAAGGLTAAGREVLVGQGGPMPPTGLSATNVDATTVTLSWSSTPNAARYALYWVSIRNGGSPVTMTLVATTTDTSYGIGFLFPGTWNYQFCIAAYNGNLETAHTNCVIPDVYPGYSPGDRRAVVPRNSTTFTNTTEAVSMIKNKKFQKLYQLLRQNTTFYP
ncbi:hypothetical protein GQ53DRAFT_875336 [Thozetella sp. PMI_491]|nr:hypothetical protein GQ53DRAFT_875336 [Thozetella sp. PMI_491]